MEYSDYELYQLLEENNYETSRENLLIFKEGLENGTILLEKPFVDDRTGKITKDEDIAVERLSDRTGEYSGIGKTSGRKVHYEAPDIDDVKKVYSEHPEREKELTDKMKKEIRIRNTMAKKIGNFEDSPRKGEEVANTIFYRTAKKRKITDED